MINSNEFAQLVAWSTGTPPSPHHKRAIFATATLTSGEAPWEGDSYGRHSQGYRFMGFLLYGIPPAGGKPSGTLKPRHPYFNGVLYYTGTNAEWEYHVAISLSNPVEIEVVYKKTVGEATIASTTNIDKVISLSDPLIPTYMHLNVASAPSAPAGQLSFFLMAGFDPGYAAP